jgi:hypothetical protein
MRLCGLARLHCGLRLARQEHGDAGDNGDGGEGDWDEFESIHGGSPGKYYDVAVQYRRVPVINKLSVRNAVNSFGE